MPAAFWPLSLCRSFARPRPVSKTPLDNSKSPRFVRLLNSSSETNLWRVVHSQLRHDFVCRFLRMSGECAQNLQTLTNTRQMTATQTRITEGAETRVVRHRTHTQLSCRRQESPTSMDYRSGERARTITTTENTCSSPGYPVTTDLCHFRTL